MPQLRGEGMISLTPKDERVAELLTKIKEVPEE